MSLVSVVKTATKLLDGEGRFIDTPIGESGDAALSVHVEHLHQTQWLHSTYVHEGAADTLNGAVSGGDKVITLNDATGFTAGDTISLSLGAVHTHQYRKIISIATNDLTLDAAIDIDLTDGSVVQEVNRNMALADGSVTPVVFAAFTVPGEKIDVMRMILTMSHKSPGTDDAFGSLAALTNGIHIRKNNGDGTYETLGVWKTNQDIRGDMYDLSYSDKAGPSLHGTSTRWSIFDGTGSVVNINGNRGESIEVVVQDNLTASTGELSTLFINWQGHIELNGG
jgi:hypothetical protein